MIHTPANVVLDLLMGSIPDRGIALVCGAHPRQGKAPPTLYGIRSRLGCSACLWDPSLMRRCGFSEMTCNHGFGNASSPYLSSFYQIKYDKARWYFTTWSPFLTLSDEMVVTLVSLVATAPARGSFEKALAAAMAPLS